jgi:hypothetical protein
MKPVTMLKLILLLTIMFTPIASATYYYDTHDIHYDTQDIRYDTQDIRYDTQDIQQRVIEEAKRQNISPSLALAIAKVESNFNHQALSHAGAKGVMQIMPRTAEQVFGVSRSRLFDPDVNIELGVAFIKKLLKRYNGRLDIALSHYNGGSRVKNKHGELRVMPATRHYVDKVLATQQDFLKHDDDLQHANQPLFTARVNQSGISFLTGNTGKSQTEPQILKTHSQDPQIETLRALRLHNITRNYKGNRALAYRGRPVNHIKPLSVQATLYEKSAKVRQWESIYLD